MKKILKLATPVNLTMLGLLIGGVVARIGAWDFLEPVIAFAQLGFLAAALFAVRQLQGYQSMQQKSYEITFGLRAGYEGEGSDFTLEQARQALKAWMQQRIELQLPIVAGKLQQEEIIYPVRNGADGQRVTAEPSCRFYGALSAAYDRGRSDDEVIVTLTNLAEFLAQEFSQQRVYISYGTRQWIAPRGS